VSNVVVEVSDAILSTVIEDAGSLEKTISTPVQVTIDPSLVSSPPPAVPTSKLVAEAEAETEIAPDMANYVVSAVDIIGITPETFELNATTGFENATAAVVGLSPPAIEIITVDVPDDGDGTRVKFVIKTFDMETADTVRTLLKLELHDNPKRFTESLRAHGLSTVKGVLEVPLDSSTVRKTLTAPPSPSPSFTTMPSKPSKPLKPAMPPPRSTSHPPPPPAASAKLVDQRIAVVLICSGFLIAMTVAGAVYTALNRPGWKSLRSGRVHRVNDSGENEPQCVTSIKRKRIRSRRVAPASVSD